MAAAVKTEKKTANSENSSYTLNTTRSCDPFIPYALTAGKINRDELVSENAIQCRVSEVPPGVDSASVYQHFESILKARSKRKDSYSLHTLFLAHTFQLGGKLNRKTLFSSVGHREHAPGAYFMIPKSLRLKFNEYRYHDENKRTVDETKKMILESEGGHKIEAIWPDFEQHPETTTAEGGLQYSLDLLKSVAFRNLYRLAKVYRDSKVNMDDAISSCSYMTDKDITQQDIDVLFADNQLADFKKRYKKLVGQKMQLEHDLGMGVDLSAGNILPQGLIPWIRIE